MTIQMVCPRDYVLRTRMGHTIRFIAGEPASVPEAAYAEALSKNIVPVARPDGDSPAFGMIRAEVTGTLRDAMIYGAIRDIIARNQTDEFTGGGVPKAAAVSAEAGVSVSATEVNRYYQNYREILAENEELPTHPQVEVVKELQACATRTQLTQFAKEHGYEMPNAKGKSNKEVKELLLHAVVNEQMTAAPPAADEYVKPDSLTED